MALWCHKQRRERELIDPCLRTWLMPIWGWGCWNLIYSNLIFRFRPHHLLLPSEWRSTCQSWQSGQVAGLWLLEKSSPAQQMKERTGGTNTTRLSMSSQRGFPPFWNNEEHSLQKCSKFIQIGLWLPEKLKRRSNGISRYTPASQNFQKVLPWIWAALELCTRERGEAQNVSMVFFQTAVKTS